ncbi:hypothetical protein E2C01_074456 [Portunus trituberculatus]|uniref:Uncharacterized protein n=1 Tax=Portunus trituberculatus TaxID=210409 RepID=A0A5B7I831_PORTR|nr:hypothetical protein [Portunus trituberculatus]
MEARHGTEEVNIMSIFNWSLWKVEMVREQSVSGYRSRLSRCSFDKTFCPEDLFLYRFFTHFTGGERSLGSASMGLLRGKPHLRPLLSTLLGHGIVQM